MKREIKFRFWDMVNKKWKSPDDHKFGVIVTGDGFEFSTGYNSYDSPTFGHYYDDEEYNKIPDKEYEEKQNQFIPCQFTGLKDKNGKEIYEGDILRDRDNEQIIISNYNEFIYLVLYSEEHSGLWGRTQKHIEVIGNIYENPELL